ncbi:hypothetical protein BU204_02975 [Actinophytocola xanthii]|uniref:Bacteriocin-protection protein n=1 Tax=Actinophytocola xanthii TaxID=1912961 RepID=A0A1Q8CXM4_9PSEU|nr:hypothetical protein BU204_02975 [Actinophytocola xanthii]
MSEKDGLPVLVFAGRAEFAAWLAENAETRGVWVKLARKDSGITSVTYREALEEALRHGWIDGQSKSLDDQYHLRRFTPRTRRSRWSKINREAAERLVEEGRMTERGLREVEAARADGRWDAAYAGPASATVPEDLRSALDANPAAAAFFATLNSANRYAILHRIEEAKRAETRARRIEKFVGMLEREETLH